MTTRILLAEDEPAARIPMVRYLKRHNFDVVDVVDPNQAKDALREAQELDDPFDVVILDLIMPANNERGGEEVLDYMKATKTSSRVILATAYGYNGPAERLKKKFPQFDPKVLTKTFTPDQLLAAVRAVTAKRKKADGKKASPQPA